MLLQSVLRQFITQPTQQPNSGVQKFGHNFSFRAFSSFVIINDYLMLLLSKYAEDLLIC